MVRCEALNDQQSAGAKLLRRRSRVPYVFSLQLVKVVKDRGWFKLRSSHFHLELHCHPQRHHTASVDVDGHGPSTAGFERHARVGHEHAGAHIHCEEEHVDPLCYSDRRSVLLLQWHQALLAAKRSRTTRGRQGLRVLPEIVV